MFQRLAPQRVRHRSGFIVQIASRESVELLQTDGSVVRVEVEFGPVSSLHRATLREEDRTGREVQVTEQRKDELMSQLKAGLEAMSGAAYEIVRT